MSDTATITDHRFAVGQFGGIGPHPDGKECVECGAPKSKHAVTCRGALNVRGEHFACDLTAPHDGWAHSNTAAEAIWQ